MMRGVKRGKRGSRRDRASDLRGCATYIHASHVRFNSWHFSGRAQFEMCTSLLQKQVSNAHACLRGDSRLFTCSHNLCTSAIVARFLLGVSVALQKESVLWRSFEQEFNHFYFW